MSVLRIGGTSRGTLAGMMGLLLTNPAFAGGPENALLIVDPARPESMYIANYYQNARNIPAQNIVYMNPLATNFATFADINAKAVFGVIDNRRLRDHADFLIATSPASFYIPATGTISDGCSPVSRFSVSAAYTNCFNTAEILAGIGSTNPNRYYSTTNTAIAFDSSTSWVGGSPAAVRARDGIFSAHAWDIPACAETRLRKFLH